MVTPQTPTDDDQVPADYPVDWIQDTIVKDGGTCRIRPILPSDADGLQAFVRGMSAESSYLRFFRVKSELTGKELKEFTRLDYLESMAFVALIEGVIIGVGRYNISEDQPGVAEVAFTVADGMQGKGIGTVLLYRLTAYARAQGIDRFKAFLLADNHAMMRVFRNAGFKMKRDVEEGVYTVDFPTSESKAVREAEGEAERRATAASLMPLFYPQSVAVIGASRNHQSIGGRLMNNILAADYMGPVYPINPKVPVIRSMPAYRSILDIPKMIDLAFIVVPGPLVKQVVKECAEAGVRGVCVISAGFSETGEQGAKEEEEILEIVRDAGMRMIGPNCMGLLNTDPVIQLDGQFGPQMPAQGNVAMLSQSGALGLAIIDYANELGIGISTFVSVGNKTDIGANDMLLFWEDDPNTDVILLYLESFGNPRRFGRIARRIGKKKPVAVVKSGRTKAGARAASSHTGSLASLDVAVDALFDQAGVVRVDTLEELFDVTSLLANQPAPKGRRVGLITNAGGPAILAVDALESQGLEVPQFGDELQAKMQEYLMADASTNNPVDMIASAGPEEYKKTIQLLLDSDEIDALITLFIPASDAGVKETATAIREAVEEVEFDKTFMSVYMHSGGAPSELESKQVDFPVFSFPERAARALRQAVDYAEWLDKPIGSAVEFDDLDRETAREIIDRQALDEDPEGDDEGKWLDPDDVDAILAAYGINIPKARVVDSVADAVAFGDEIDGPIVLKVISPSAVHKSDVGGVALDINGKKEIEAAYEQVTSAVPDPEGVLVQEFVAGGHEVLIGMVEDPNFGPLIVFGLGGVFVELIGDVAFRIHPLTDLAAADMIKEVKSSRLLEGYRGGDPGDIEAVEETLLRVSALVEDLPEIFEMDLNPVKVGTPGDGVRIVDARIKIRPVTRSYIPSRTDLPSAL